MLHILQALLSANAMRKVVLPFGWRGCPLATAALLLPSKRVIAHVNHLCTAHTRWPTTIDLMMSGTASQT
jgi:hypothetical protein